MKRNKLALLCGTIAALLLGSCTASRPSPPHAVTLIAKSTQTTFWLSVFAGAQAAATEYNIDLTIVGPDKEEDYQAQNLMVNQAVESGADALIFSAIHQDNSIDVLDAAARQGVKLVSIDSNAGSQSIQTYIGTNNYAAGQMAAQAALEQLDGFLSVGIINYDASSANGQERERGAVDAFTQSGRAQVVSVINTLADAAQAQRDTSSLLTAHPEMNVLLALNEPTSVGAAQAIQTHGLSEDVFLVGFDSNVKSIDGLQNGSVDALVVQNPYAMGYLGVESAYRLLSGQDRNLGSTIDTSTQIVHRGNLFAEDSQKALFAFEF